MNRAVVRKCSRALERKRELSAWCEYSRVPPGRIRCRRVGNRIGIRPRDRRANRDVQLVWRKGSIPKEAAPTGIGTDVDDPPGVGAGVGVGDGVGEGAVEGDELLPPQAAANARSADKTARRNDDIRTSEHEAVKRALHCS